MVLRYNYVNNPYLLNIKRIEMLALFRIPSQSNPSLKKQKSSDHALLLVLSKVTVLMHVNLLRTTVKMGFIILRVLILINHTVQWQMITHS